MSEETGFIDSNNREIAGIDMDEKIENQLNLSLSLTPKNGRRAETWMWGMTGSRICGN